MDAHQKKPVFDIDEAVYVKPEGPNTGLRLGVVIEYVTTLTHHRQKWPLHNIWYKVRLPDGSTIDRYADQLKKLVGPDCATSPLVKRKTRTRPDQQMELYHAKKGLVTQLLNSNLTMGKVALKAGISLSTLGRWIKTGKFENRQKGAFDDQVTQVNELLKGDLSLAKVAFKAGIADSTLRRWLKSGKVFIPPK